MNQFKGLTTQEVLTSRSLSGKNIVAQTKRTSPVRLLYSQFRSPVMLVLIAAGIISYLLHGVTDSIVVFIAVTINGFLGFYQEFRAEKSLEMLERIVKVKSEVLRDGKRQTVDLEEIVVGDIVFVKAGDKIPGDSIVLESSSLAVNESMLTGESAAVIKKNSLEYNFKKCPEDSKTYMGTIVVSGLGKLLVANVGASTAMGKIASSLQSTIQAPTELQREMNIFAILLSKIVIVVAGALVAVGLVRGMPLTEIFLVAVAVAVSAIPEGMAITLTVILSIGMQRMLKRQGLVRKLVAAETLGTVSVVCADKTGTLTKGELRVVGTEGDEKLLAKAGVLGSDMADPIETAIKEWGEEIYRSTGDTALTDWVRIETRPFDPASKFGINVNRSHNSYFSIMRGAPETVLEYCNLSTADKKNKISQCRILAGKGYRLIAVATATQIRKKASSSSFIPSILKSKSLEFAGIVLMEDPVRQNMAQEIAKLKTYNVEFKVITGDFAETAEYVMHQLGINVHSRIMLASDFRQMSAAEQITVVKNSILFARFSPDDKLKIVTILQSLGHKVVMMGDGVNDAPALKRADLGVVVSTASDVAKETADMILLDNEFRTIIAGIEEGRSILERIKRVIRYLLSDSLSEVLIVSIAMLIGIPLPITAVQILWVNLANDTFPAIALAMDKVQSDIIRDINPLAKSKLIDRQIKYLIAIVSAVSGLLVLGFFLYILGSTGELIYARTSAFAFLGINTLFTVFVIRNMDKPLWQTDFFENKYLWAGVAIGIIMQFSAVYWSPLQSLLGTVPLQAREWWLISGGTVLVILSIEVIKSITGKNYAKR